MILDGVRRTSAPKLAADELGRGDARLSCARSIGAPRSARPSRRRAPGDVVLIAGKGHEDYQIVGTTKHHFDDREEAAAALAARGCRDGDGQSDDGDGAAPARRSLDWAARAMGGAIVQAGTRATHFAGANHDSRAVAPGQLFFALPGRARRRLRLRARRPRRAGATGIVVARGARHRPPACDGVTVIEVDDPRRGAGRPGARRARRRSSGAVVGVTGSNGKTTTKELCAAGARRRSARCCAHRGQLQHRRRPAADHPVGDRRARRVWVLEMAMRGLGEIAYLAEIARPHVGVITNVGRRAPRAARLAREGRARQGRAVRGRSAADGVAVLPADDPLHRARRPAHVARRRGASRSAGARRGDVRVLEVVPGRRGGARSSATPSADGSRVVGAPAARRARTTRANARGRAGGGAGARRRRGSRPRAALATVALPPHRSALGRRRRAHRPRRLLQRQPGVDARGAATRWSRSAAPAARRARSRCSATCSSSAPEPAAAAPRGGRASRGAALAGVVIASARSRGRSPTARAPPASPPIASHVGRTPRGRRRRARRRRGPRPATGSW